MKKFILSAIAATLVASPIAATAAEAAPIQRHGPGADRHDRRGAQTQYRSWRKGQRFDQRYAQNYRQIDYRQYRGLRAPPRGYRYVQSGNDAVLVGITSGLIASVFAGAIR